MSICGRIGKNIAFNCAKPMVGGAKDAVYIINYDDIETLTRDEANPQLIRDISLVDEAVVYKWEGPVNSVLATASLSRKKYKNVYQQMVGIPAMDNSSELKQELEAAAYSKVVVVVENNYQEGDSIFEIYFLERGGFLIKNERDVNNADLEGGYDLNFGQDDTARESHLPATFAVEVAEEYSYSATKAALEALVGEGEGGGEG